MTSRPIRSLPWNDAITERTAVPARRLSRARMRAHGPHRAFRVLGQALEALEALLDDPLARPGLTAVADAAAGSS